MKQAFLAIVVWIARLGFSGIFLFAAAPKIIDPAAFALAIGHYRLIPTPGPALVAHTLPWLELVIALALLVGRRWLAAAWLLALGLSTVFLIAVASAWWRGLDIACGCFGSETPIGFTDVALRALLVLVSAAVFTHCSGRSYRRAQA
jgi:uncharacterized membrane protein YphA (DoxX/SURF4 family)